MLVAGVGLVGSALIEKAREHGWKIRTLHRSDSGQVTGVQYRENGDEFAYWNPAKHELDPAAVVGADAVVCLNGAAIAPNPWTKSRRKLLRASRLDSTETLAQTMANLPAVDRPKVFLSGSAIGFYGDRGEARLSDLDSHQVGQGFLANLCQEWEACAQVAEDAGIRTAQNRTGLVVSDRGGIGAMLEKLYRFGLGARLGDGRQWQAYIGLDDAASALLFALENDNFTGPFNLTSPVPIRNKDLHDFLSWRAKVPSPWVAPAPAVKLAGDMGKELLLASARTFPDQLEKAGFEFANPDAPSMFNRYFGAK
ncbi:TIGR01777 family protein [Boudabousia tangfeifanii]|uniref:TIGR01777 family protein n=1 Tax=Boudabousia tangfeifanii TaxID=1912795 RepID=A0A1D9MMQ5_9ACTO|nr:TIGR01777 family protein [Boudabousia tangfeifanii]